MTREVALSLALAIACACGATVVSGAEDATEREVIVVPVDAENPTGRGETPRPQDETPRLQCPAALAPAYREFASKCAAKTATRGDLIALKKFIAASAIDAAAKTNLTRQVRKIYQRSKKRDGRLRK